MSKHTIRTLKLLRDLDYTADVVERWLPIPSHPGGGKRKDFLGIIDIIAFNHREIIGVQSCSTAWTQHVDTILESDQTVNWLQGGRELWLIGWRKLKVKRGGKAFRWRPRKAYFYLINGEIEYGEDR